MNTASHLLAYKSKQTLFADHIREKILNGELKKHDRLQTDVDLSRQYQIDKQTVAAGLNILVTEGLLERAPRRGTVVKNTGKENKFSNAVGLVMLSEGDVDGSIARRIFKEFLLRDLYPVLIDRRLIDDHRDLIPFLNSLISEQAKPYGFLIDGCISFPFPFQYFKDRTDSFRNTVFIRTFQHPERIAAAKYALVDFHDAGRQAARHFIGMGHTSITCLAMHETKYQGTWSSMQAQIMAGFAHECRENNISFSDEIFWALLHGAPLDSTVRSLLRKKDRPTAIFSYFDFFVRDQIVPLLESNGLKPMKDIELIGFNNTHHAEECGFSSISIREEKIAEAAVKLLTGETDEREIMIKPELVVRGEGNRQ